MIFKAFAVFMIIVSFYAYYDSQLEFYCLERSSVESILELKHGSAVILLANGETILVNQATLEIGDNYCLKGERR